MRELLVILAIVLLLFGARRLRTIGSDLGGALRGFRDATASEAEPSARAPAGVADRSDG